MDKFPLHSLPTALGSTALCVVSLLAQTLSFAGDTPTQDRQRLPESIQRVLDVQAEVQKELQLNLLIQPGTELQAKNYYQRISGKGILNFQLEGSTLDSLLSYLGYTVSNGSTPSIYSGLLARDLESLPSFLLMPRNESEFATLKGHVSDPAAFDALLDLADFQQDRVLVSRFFAPKIATYYDKQNHSRPIDPDTIVPGWRKLVRLTARPNSPADQAGILHLYLLFNVKQVDPDVDPFDAESGNNQVILVPRDQDVKDSIYFAVYGPRTGGYQIGYFLGADFDLPGHVGVSLPGAKDSNYYVPVACAECHGHSGKNFSQGLPVDPISGEETRDFSVGIYRYAKPNYLDTDQWYDWMEFDFRGVTTSLNDVLFDGGKAHGSSSYERAMDVMRKLNTTIRDQTFAAEQVQGVKSYQTLAAEKWISLHMADIQRAPYSSRSIGNEQWDPTNTNEMRLLRLLNNHCFRCHSSIKYNVFDREAVKNKKFLIKYFISTRLQVAGVPLPGYMMPQGRVLKDEERDEIIRLMNIVFP